MFSASFLVALLPLLGSAAAESFTLIAARSASPIHLQSINANSKGFWIGLNTTTYCPGSVVDCSGLTNVTALAVNTAAGTAGLDTEVPGGQQVYVTAQGELGFTTAHSASIPSGASTTGFNYTAPADGQSYGYFTTSVLGSTGFIACPNKVGAYKIYADTTDSSFSDECLGFNALAVSTSSSPSAWQYV